MLAASKFPVEGYQPTPPGYGLAALLPWPHTLCARLQRRLPNLQLRMPAFPILKCQLVGRLFVNTVTRLARQGLRDVHREVSMQQWPQQCIGMWAGSMLICIVRLALGCLRHQSNQ